jgi:general secretion pathway protein D
MMGGIPNFAAPSGLSGKTTAVPLSPETFTLGYMRDSSILGFVLLNATGKDKKMNILSTPHILTLDNHEAEFNVGEEIAVPTNNRITETNTIYYTFEYKPVGLKLKLTPHITDGTRIVIDLYIETNQVLDATNALSSGVIIPPDLGKRDMKTKILVADGSTIVVGGLIKKTTTEAEIKVPILGDIPLLGWFFKTKRSEDSKANLLVFITPKIISETEQMKKVTDERRDELNKMKEENYK